jgi:mediator of RNA polymerase II transcription subunit 16
MMMEEGLDVDDLFGGPSSLELGLAPAPATKGLAQRLDELRLLGCCQYVLLDFFLALQIPRNWQR